MSGSQLKTPVAIFIFNRPETTERVFTEVARVKPTMLLVVADGPRPGFGGESQRCLAARAIVNRIDWPCEILTNYADTNMGCRLRVSSGLDWVFENVDEAIILEDDCVPNPTFFRFCGELLDIYRNNCRVMHISGDNFQYGRKRGNDSYYFSRYPHVWGWATWRRAWRHYDVNMRLWTSARDKSVYLDSFRTEGERRFWRETWDAVSAGRVDTWDYQWVFACVAHGGMAVMPNLNLVSNIGFGPGSTHTTTAGPGASLPTKDLSFPLRHPIIVATDDEADQFTARIFFTRQTRLVRALRRVWRVVLGKSTVDGLWQTL